MVQSKGTFQIYDERIERLLEASKSPLRDALNSYIFIRPVVSSSAKECILKYIDIGQEERVTLALDGHNSKLPVANYDGYFVDPTVFTEVTLRMRIAKE